MSDEKQIREAAGQPVSSARTRFGVYELIDDERDRQDAKWGEQNHRDGTGYDFERRRDDARRACEQAFAEGVGTWVDILTEEFYEALAETDPVRLRQELIEVASVAVAWVQAIERRLAATREPESAFDRLSEDDKATWIAMAAEMKEEERRGPPYVSCGCGYPVKPCLRVVLRNGPPYPDRPCEPAALTQTALPSPRSSE